MFLFLFALTLVPLTEHTVKLQEGAAVPAASVNELSWLAGRWVGEGLGGTTEETWNPPAGGAMTGTFRLLKDDKPVFYEFMTLLRTERGVVMRLKHFNPDLVGWEEKDKFVDFLYVGAAPPIYRFEGLTFHRDGERRVTIYLALRQKNGEVREETFTMRRANP